MARPLSDVARPPPAHVAIIMDGNGRWARARGLPRMLGHREGAKAVRRTVEAAARLRIGHLTLFGFSTENWGRPADEVTELMRLLRHYLSSEIAELHKNGIRLQVIGERHRLPADVVDLLRQAERVTGDNRALTLTVALSYGGRQEIAAAARLLAEDVAAGRLAASDVDEAALQERLSTFGMPDPDLVIRTSGEQRISNFLLWQSAYAEFVFLDTLWPDFDGDDLARAVDEYQRRERRYGVSVSGP